MTRDSKNVKWGSENLSAMGRQGLSELRGAMYADSNVAQPPQPGIYGTKSQGEVADSRRADGAERDHEPASQLESKLQELDAQQEREAPEPEREEP